MGREDFNISVQVFTGVFDEKAVDFDAIKNKLDAVYRLFSIDRLIIGWRPDRQLYRQVKQYLEEHQTKMILWLPVFSELGSFRKFEPVVDFNGREIDSYMFQNGESFEFYCPASKRNLENVKSVFEEQYEDACFDGVFLDKIRYPSLANGLRSVFSCFCKDCTAAMEAEGLDTGELISEIRRITDGGGLFELKEPISVIGNDSFIYSFENPMWKRFFDFRSNSVSRSVHGLYDYFRGKGLSVGLDIFAHSIGYFVGQEAAKLEDYADFIKPMYYRKAMAPAGIPFERQMLQRVFAMKPCCQALTRDEDNTYPLEKALQEYKILQKLGNKTPIYPGIEINRDGQISPVYPGDVEENLEVIQKSGLKGVVLAWNVMEAPEENLRAVRQYFSGASC